MLATSHEDELPRTKAVHFQSHEDAAHLPACKIKTLLESKEHRAAVEDIARQFLINDEPQLQYYKYITKVMPAGSFAATIL